MDIIAKKRLNGVQILLIVISALFLAVMLLLPLFTVVAEAFRKGLDAYMKAVTDSYTVSATVLTLEATAAAVVFNTIFGLFAAWAVTKFHFRGKKLLTVLIDLPVTVSPIIAGLIYVLLFGRQSVLYPILQSLNIQIIFAVPGIILATIFVTFPFISRELMPVLEAQGTDEEEAAALMGAGGFTIFRRVTLPHIKWALLYGIVLCTARAMGEFGAVSVLSGHLRGKTNTLPLHVEILFNEFQYVPAFAVSSILVILAIVLLVFRSVLEYKGKKGRKYLIMYLELKHINKKYGDFAASDDVSFQIEKGRLVGLLGPSGSGKTTILRMIAGLETPDSGDIIIDGKVVNDIPASMRGIGFVFQNYALFRYMTVEDNVAFGLTIQKADKELIRERVETLLELVGLAGLGKRYPSQLSGGQRQRVAFARALAPQPHLLLLDEPFAAIDAKVRKELRSWLKEMIEKLGITSIFVTHDQDEAIEVADDLIITNKGRVEQTGSPVHIYQHPETAFTASFIGQPTIIANYNNYQKFDEVKDYSEVIIRPEFIRLSKIGTKEKYEVSSTEGIVEDMLFRGTHIEIKVRVGDDVLTATRKLEEEPVEIGETVSIFLYRLFVTQGEKIVQLNNRAMKESSLVI